MCLWGAVAIAYWFFFYRSDESRTTKNEPHVPGWDDLIRCSDMVSLDGTETLTLEKDHRVTFRDKGRLKTPKESEHDFIAQGK
jgi:hypothetical protein